MWLLFRLWVFLCKKYLTDFALLREAEPTRALGHIASPDEKRLDEMGVPKLSVSQERSRAAVVYKEVYDFYQALYSDNKELFKYRIYQFGNEGKNV